MLQTSSNKFNTALMGPRVARSTGSDHVHFGSRYNLARPNPSADSDNRTGRSRLSEKHLGKNCQFLGIYEAKKGTRMCYVERGN